MKQQVNDALIGYAVANYRAFGQWGLRQHGSVSGVREFAELYNSKMDKIERRGKLGPKGWDKLRAACPEQAKPYFAELYRLGSGPDLTTSEGLNSFVTVSQALARQAGQPPRPPEADLVNALLSAMAEPEDEDEDTDEDE